MDNVEFYIMNDGLRIHCKLDLPKDISPEMLDLAGVSHMDLTHPTKSVSTDLTYPAQGVSTDLPHPAEKTSTDLPHPAEKTSTSLPHPAEKTSTDLPHPAEKTSTDLPENAGRKYPLLILIHGYTGHMEEPHIRAIAQTAADCGYIVLRPEMYGHGKSDGLFRKHTMIKWMDQALAILDFAQMFPFVSGLYLAGHSQGGLLAMLTGAMERDRLKALLLLSPAILIKDEARKGHLLGMTFDPEHIPDEVPNPDKDATPAQATLGGNYFRAAQFLPISEAIAAVHLPVLIIHGQEDATVPVHYAHDAAAAYDHCTLKIIPDETHCYDHHLDQVCEAVREFLTCH